MVQLLHAISCRASRDRAISKVPRPAGRTVVALVCEFDAVSHTDEASVHIEGGLAQNVFAKHTRGLKVGRRRQLVSLGHRGQGCSAHAVLLALGKHATAVAVVHVVLYVVQGATGLAVEVPAVGPPDGVGGVRHVVVLIAVVCKTRVVAVAPRVAEVEPVAHLVGQCARPVQVGGADGPAVGVLQDDAVLVGVLVAVHRTGVERIARGTRRVFAHPHVEVFVAGPLDEFLHLGIPDVGQFTDDAVDARVAVAVGIALGQTKLDFNVRHNVLELGNDFVDVGVECAKVGVQHIHRILNLGRGNVLRTVEVDDVEDNGDDQHIFPLGCRGTLLRFKLKRTCGLDGGVARLRPTQKQHLFRVIQATRRDAVVGVCLGDERRGQQTQEQRERPRAEREGHGFDESIRFAGTARYVLPF